MSLQFLTNPGLIWFIVGLILLLTELFAPTLILLFFGFGSWIVTALYLMFGIGLSIQLAVFAVSSILLLLLLRRRLKPVFLGYVSSRQNPAQDIEDVLGKQAVVVVRIEPDKPGKVEFNGVLWDAVAETPLAPEVRVKIMGRDGLKLKVSPL